MEALQEDPVVVEAEAQLEGDLEEAYGLVTQPMLSVILPSSAIARLRCPRTGVGEGPGEVRASCRGPLGQSSRRAQSTLHWFDFVLGVCDSEYIGDIRAFGERNVPGLGNGAGLRALVASQVDGLHNHHGAVGLEVGAGMVISGRIIAKSKNVGIHVIASRQKVAFRGLTGCAAGWLFARFHTAQSTARQRSGRQRRRLLRQW